jgi:ribose transport system permease protein
MTAVTMQASRGFSINRMLRRHGGLAMALAVFVVIFAGLNLSLAHPFSYFDLASTLNNTETLAIAAMGQTIVVIVGGLDLSAGAVISLTNCIVTVGLGDSSTPLSGVTWMAAGIASGCVVGAVNGFFIAYMRLQPIVVTLATMFVVQGVTLLVIAEPGGAVSADYNAYFTGDVISNVLPSSLFVILLLLLAWAVLKRTRFGIALYAVGSDESAANANGIDSRGVKFTAYVIAGACYGFAGVVLTAQSGSADPLVGPPMLLPIFVAVLLGGTRLGGGRGGCLGTFFGALILMLMVNLLLVLNVTAYFSTAAEGFLLILAMLGGAFSSRSPLAQHWRRLLSRWGGMRSARASPAAPLRLWSDRAQLREDNELPASIVGRWLAVNRDTLRFILPAYIALVIVLALTAVVLGHRVTFGEYANSFLVLASFPAVIVLGQGVVILTGGLDLSLPWMITLAGVLLTGMTHSNAALVWSVPAVLAVGAFVGAVNGAGIAILGISPIVMTLAMNGILQAVALIYCGGAPLSLAPSGLHWMMRGEFLYIPPIVWLLIPFVIGASLMLTRTSFGRQIYAVGNSVRVAELSGVPVTAVIIAAYAISSVCAALVGLMLSGFGFEATLGMGDAFLLPSIAAAVVGGTLITGGRGRYVGMLGGALLLTALSTLLSGILMPAAIRGIIFGVVVLAAVIALRERQVS